MSLIKCLFQPAKPVRQASTPSVQEHANFWMFQCVSRQHQLPVMAPAARPSAPGNACN